MISKSLFLKDNTGFPLFFFSNPIPDTIIQLGQSQEGTHVPQQLPPPARSSLSHLHQGEEQKARGRKDTLTNQCSCCPANMQNELWSSESKGGRTKTG